MNLCKKYAPIKLRVLALRLNVAIVFRRYFAFELIDPTLW